MMQRQIVFTTDGSHTVSIPEMNVTYHSVHGAIQESRHVFIEAGLKYVLEFPIQSEQLHLFEIGLGTGLNALLTLIESETIQQSIHYTAIEPFPLSTEEISLLNYCEQLKRADLLPAFKKLHSCEWEKESAITTSFSFYKSRQSLLQFTTINRFDLVYFDAFDPAAQPELWTTEVFKNLYSLLLRGGILVTYCSKGDVRRAMQSVGFNVEKLAGPPGKREIIRAIK